MYFDRAYFGMRYYAPLPVKERLIGNGFNNCMIYADRCAIEVIQKYGGAIFVVETIS